MGAPRYIRPCRRQNGQNAFHGPPGASRASPQQRICWLPDPVGSHADRPCAATRSNCAGPAVRDTVRTRTVFAAKRPGRTISRAGSQDACPGAPRPILPRAALSDAVSQTTGRRARLGRFGSQPTPPNPPWSADRGRKIRTAFHVEPARSQCSAPFDEPGEAYWLQARLQRTPDRIPWQARCVTVSDTSSFALAAGHRLRYPRSPSRGRKPALIIRAGATPAHTKPLKSGNDQYPHACVATPRPSPEVHWREATDCPAPAPARRARKRNRYFRSGFRLRT